MVPLKICGLLVAEQRAQPNGYTLASFRSTVELEMNGSDPADNLLDAAKLVYPDLTTSESRLLDCAQNGEIAYCGPTHSDKDSRNEPKNAEMWGRDRSIRAELIAWLCIHKHDMVHPHGVQIHAALILGSLNLEFLDSSLHLMFLNCWFPDAILLRALAVRELSFAGSRISSLDLRRATVKGSLFLNLGALIEQIVILDRVQIGQDLECSGSTFAGKRADGKGMHEYAIGAPGIVVGSHVYLSGDFKSVTGVNLADAQIGGSLIADGGHFECLYAHQGAGSTSALDLRSVQVRKDIGLGSGLRCNGKLILDRIVCGGNIDLTGACRLDGIVVDGDDDSCFSAEDAHVGGDILFDDGFEAKGVFSVAAAHIAGDLQGIGGSCSPLRGSMDVLNAENAVVEGDVLLRRIALHGAVSLDGCVINGDLDFSGAAIRSAEADPGEDTPLSVQRATVKGSVLLTDDFRCLGTVSVGSTRIGANLNMEKALLDSGASAASNDADSFIGDEASVGGALLADGLISQGMFSVFHLSVMGNFEADGSKFINPFRPGAKASGVALKAGRISVKGHLRLVGSQVRGKADLSNASIEGDFYCSSTVFCESVDDLEPAAGSSLNLDSTQIGGALYLSTTRDRAQFVANGRVVLDYLHCDGGVFFDGAFCNNPLIPGRPASGVAVSVFSAKLSRGLYLRTGFRARGEVSILNSTVGEAISCRGGSFTSPNITRGDHHYCALVIRSTTAASIYLDSSCKIDGVLDLSDSRTFGYADDWRVWPAKGSLQVEGFSYREFLNPPQTADQRIAWLRLQPSVPFPSGSYRQLAKFLADTGDSTGSQMVLVALEDDLTRQPTYPAWQGLAKRIAIGRTVGYGQQPLNAIWELVGLTALGWIIYRRSYLAGHMVPTDKDAREAMKVSGQPSSDYESFSPLIYSLENSIPLVKLGQADKWRPVSHLGDIESAEIATDLAPVSIPQQNAWTRLKRSLGVRPLDRLAAPPYVRYFLWFQILLGWVLGTLFVAGFTGLIKGK